MLNALVMPTAMLGCPVPSTPLRRLQLVKKDNRISAQQFDQVATQLPRRMKTENVTLARRVLVDGLTVADAAKEQGVSRANGQAVVSRVRVVLARSQETEKLDNERWQRVSMFAPPSIAREIRDAAKGHSLPVELVKGRTNVEQARRPERRESMTIAEFEAVKKKLPARLQPSSIDVAYRVLVKGETKNSAAKAHGLSSPRASAIVDRVLAAAEDAPATWKRVDVLLPAGIARTFIKRIEQEKAAIKQGAK